MGQPLKLRPFQRKIIQRIYDNPQGTRRALVSMGRKNAKTTLAACLLLLHLAGPEAQANAQLNSAAQSRDQAALLFGLAAKMVRLSPDLGAVVTVRDSTQAAVLSGAGHALPGLERGGDHGPRLVAGVRRARRAGAGEGAALGAV